MLSEKMMKLGKKRSVIRELFEYGNRRKAEIGAENVFDFSLGNPSVNPPACVKETIKRLLETEDDIALHGYTSAQGDAKVRAAVADYINRSFGRHLTGGHIYMTVGAAASLTISLKAMAVEGDEFITFSPFFPEYRVFVENAGGTLKVVPCNTEDFQIDRELFEQAITPGTKAVILNSPNNPSGVVLSEATVKGICEVMEKKQAEYGHAIYLITDEPYRELVYDDNIQVPYLMNYYKNTLVCYSFSKSLSLPGERIGYIAVCEEMEEWEDMYAAICGAILFGPQPRKYDFKVNKKIRKLALRMALSSRLAGDNLLVVKGFDLPEAKTKVFAKIAGNLGLSKALIIAPEESRNLVLSSRNLPGITLTTPDQLSVYEILKHKQLVLLEGAVEPVETRLK